MPVYTLQISEELPYHETLVFHNTLKLPWVNWLARVCSHFWQVAP